MVGLVKPDRAQTILVTGGAGFIGSNYIRYLIKNVPQVNIINLDKITYAGNPENLGDLEHNPRYRFIRGDILDNELVESIFSSSDIQSVVNFAAESHVDRSIENPEVFVKTNIFGTFNLLNIAKKHWMDGGTVSAGRKYIQISTDEVYGSLGDTGRFFEDSPLDPHNPYASSKAGADMMVKAFFDTYGMPVNITRCCNNYGPYQFPEKLIPLMISRALKKGVLPVHGDGLNVRDWLFVEDHCSAIELVRTRGRIGEVYNIGADNEMRIIDMVTTIVDYLKSNVDNTIDRCLIRHVCDRQGQDRRYSLDSSKIRREMRWLPRTSFSEGMRMTIEWYLKNREWMENTEYREPFAGLKAVSAG